MRGPDPSRARPGRSVLVDRSEEGAVPVEITAAEDDVNAVRIRGRVSSTPERRHLPSGDEVVALRVVVRRDDAASVDTIDVSIGPAPAAGGRRSPGQVGRRVLAAAERLTVDERVEVVGQLRRRWWEAGGARRSRLEVRGTSLARVVEDPDRSGAGPD
jgi:single-strand DNA-binding protein